MTNAKTSSDEITRAFLTMLARNKTGQPIVLRTSEYSDALGSAHGALDCYAGTAGLPEDFQTLTVTATRRDGMNNISRLDIEAGADRIKEADNLAVVIMLRCIEPLKAVDTPAVARDLESQVTTAIKAIGGAHVDIIVDIINEPR